MIIVIIAVVSVIATVALAIAGVIARWQWERRAAKRAKNDPGAMITEEIDKIIEDAMGREW